MVLFLNIFCGESNMKVAIVDDQQTDANVIISYINKYKQEFSENIDMTYFNSSVEFIETYKGEFDILFLDIEMPGSNGLEVAKEIRSKDSNVCIIFITNMAQYAVNGYEVDALDFMVKPVDYFNFKQKLSKAIRFVERHETKAIIVNAEDGVMKLDARDIVYIEKEKNNLVFHTLSEEFRERGSIKNIKNELLGLPFSECTSGCLVNFKYVSKVKKESVIVARTELPISRRLKKAFTQEFIDYVGGGL